jgi:hypothetical protein
MERTMSDQNDSTAPKPAAFPQNYQQPRPVPPSPAATAMVTSEVDRLLVTSDRLLKSQQDRLVAEEAAYETMRTQIMNDYNGKVAKLDHDTKEMLFQMHVEHEQKVADIKRLITKLTALREA